MAVASGASGVCVTSEMNSEKLSCCLQGVGICVFMLDLLLSKEVGTANRNVPDQNVFKCALYSDLVPKRKNPKYQLIPRASLFHR